MRAVLSIRRGKALRLRPWTSVTRTTARRPLSISRNLSTVSSTELLKGALQRHVLDLGWKGWRSRFYLLSNKEKRNWRASPTICVSFSCGRDGCRPLLCNEWALVISFQFVVHAFLSVLNAKRKATKPWILKGNGKKFKRERHDETLTLKAVQTHRSSMSPFSFFFFCVL